MDSQRSKTAPKEPEPDHAAILAQIQALQAQLPPSLRSAITDGNPPAASSAPKRKSTPSNATAGRVIVGASPSPKKRRLSERAYGSRDTARPIPKLTSSAGAIYSSGSKVQPTKSAYNKPHGVVVSRLANGPATSSTSKSSQNRSNSTTDSISRSTSKVERDDNLAIIEKLQPGPYEHEPPTGDPLFNNYEPNSCINLLSRKMSHEDMQEFLRGRYHLSPSLLYSVVRLQPSRQGYDVPVEGDWVTIAVVAERGKVQVTRNAVHQDGSDDENDFEAGLDDKKPKNKSNANKSQEANSKASKGKKYANLTLVDFGHKASRTSSAGVGSVSTSAGDALLRLLLFESDSMIANLKDESGANIKGTALYKGGSGGAFEEFYPRLRAGTVVAIMSPKVLRPYQGKTNNDSKTLHPTNNILAISPTTADTIKIIGHSKDLGMCEVKLKNGGVCGSWCDKRVTQVCEYHMIAAVRSKKNQRAEFSAGTSSVGLTPIPSNAHKSGPSNRNSKAFDPSAKWGLLPSAATTSRPRSDGQGSTYVMSGGMVISSSDAQHISAKKQKEFNEKIRKAKDKREKDDEELLKKLFSKDAGSVGMREVKSAQAYLKKVKGKEKETGGLAEQEEEEDEDTREREKRRSKLRNVAYNPQVLKRLGFDPTLRPGEMPKTKTDSSAHRLLPKRNADIDLGPKPGPRIRSGVIVPPEKRFELNRTSETKTDASKDPKIYDAPVIFDSDDELEFEDDNEEGGERNEETSPREDPLDHELEMEAVNGESDVGYQQDGSSDEEVILSNRRRRSIVDDEEDMDIDVHSD